MKRAGLTGWWRISSPAPFEYQRRGPAPEPRRSDGFTLIEVLTAMMILSIGLVMVLQLFSGGLNSARTSEHYTRGLFYAREKMEELLLYRKMTDEDLSGRFEDNYTWHARIRFMKPEVVEGEPIPPPFPLPLFHIYLEVRWQEKKRTRRVDLETIQTAERVLLDEADAS